MASAGTLISQADNILRWAADPTAIDRLAESVGADTD